MFRYIFASKYRRRPIPLEAYISPIIFSPRTGLNIYNFTFNSILYKDKTASDNFNQGIVVVLYLSIIIIYKQFGHYN